MPELPPLQWEGFDTPNYTQVPDQFFDMLMPYLSDAELRVLLYIMRRTFGFKKQADDISLSQIVQGIVKKDGTRLDYGAGLSKNAAVVAIKKLEAKGIILAQRNRSAARGYEATTYTLRLREPLSSKSTSPLPPLSSRSTRAGNATGQGLVIHEDIQETGVQNTENNREVVMSSPLENPMPMSPPYSPVIAGAVLDLARTLRDDLAGPGAVQEALRLWQQSGWTEARFVAQLQAATGKSRRLAAVLATLARQVTSEQ